MLNKSNSILNLAAKFFKIMTFKEKAALYESGETN